MSEPAPEPIDPPGPRYQLDEDHELFFELTDVNGHVVTSFRMPAPLNKNAAIPWSVQIALAHKDGCARVLQVVPIKPY